MIFDFINTPEWDAIFQCKSLPLFIRNAVRDDDQAIDRIYRLGSIIPLTLLLLGRWEWCPSTWTTSTRIQSSCRTGFPRSSTNGARVIFHQFPLACCCRTNPINPSRIESDPTPTSDVRDCLVGLEAIFDKKWATAAQLQAHLQQNVLDLNDDKDFKITFYVWLLGGESASLCDALLTTDYHYYYYYLLLFLLFLFLIMKPKYISSRQQKSPTFSFRCC